ncbi:MAG: peptide ABC transporter substrate-binding protein, partial [Actinobacteria bacterium]|nr:peptide ABC transporter substrate-binding protein [Actinomycetota bacterium]
AYFLWLTSFQTFMPINKKVATANKDWHAKPETFVSNGPFKLDKWEHKSKIEVLKNPNYWDKGVVKLDRIVFTQVEEESTVLTMFETDKLDMTDTVPNPEIPRLKKEGKLKVQPILGTYYYAFNNQKPPFNNPKVRKAFAMAIDRQAIVENVTKGGQIPAFAWVPPGIPDAGGKDFRDYKPKYFEENAAEAKKLLAEAGYSDPSKFPEVELLYNTNEGHKAIAEAIMEMLKKNLGITKIKLTNQEWKVFQTTRTKGNYQLARDGWLGDYIDAMTFADLFVTTSGNNDPQYRNPAYDKLIDTAKKSDDPKVRSDAMHKAEDILFEDMAIMPIYYYVHLYLQKDYVKNVFQTSLEQIDFKWAYIDKK